MGPQRGKQVAGRPCIDCGAKLIGEAEGTECEACGEIVHRERCLARHTATKHGPEADAPYR